MKNSDLFIKLVVVIFLEFLIQKFIIPIFNPILLYSNFNLGLVLGFLLQAVTVGLTFSLVRYFFKSPISVNLAKALITFNVIASLLVSFSHISILYDLALDLPGIFILAGNFIIAVLLLIIFSVVIFFLARVFSNVN